jgi:hypothetical protein
VEKRREAARRAGLSFYNNPGKKKDWVWKRRKFDPNIECRVRLKISVKEYRAVLWILVRIRMDLH